ncbi:hypothetical protein HN51_000165 [Arachis hypogaea]
MSPNPVSCAVKRHRYHWCTPDATRTPLPLSNDDLQRLRDDRAICGMVRWRSNMRFSSQGLRIIALLLHDSKLRDLTWRPTILIVLAILAMISIVTPYTSAYIYVVLEIENVNSFEVQSCVSLVNWFCSSERPMIGRLEHIPTLVFLLAWGYLSVHYARYTPTIKVSIVLLEMCSSLSLD